jgi:hypothetical protein
MGRDHQIPFESADCPEHTPKAGNVGQFQIHDIGKRDKFQKEKNALTRAPVEGATFFPSS